MKFPIYTVVVFGIILQTALPVISDSEGDIRLTTDRNAQNEGRVEIFYAGRWGGIEHRGIDDTTARVICRLLGLGSSGYEIDFYYHSTGVTRIFWSVYCDGTESNILDCIYSAYSSSYTRTYGAGVVCQELDFKLTDVRLVDGNETSEGTPQLLVSGKWMAMCDESIDYYNYNTFCRMAGYRVVEWYRREPASVGGSVDVLPFEFDCRWDIEDLNTCDKRVYSYNNCTHKGDLFMKCKDFQVTDVRLVNGNVSSEGRLELLYSDGTWNTVCDSIFTTGARETTCRQLGYRLVFGVYENAYFGVGIGGIFQYSIYCSSSQIDLDECTFVNQGQSCNHTDDVSTRCSDFEMNEVRLIGGNDSSEGRVEIQMEGEWFTVCDSYITTSYVPDTICKTLGYRVCTNVYYDAFFGEGTGGIISAYMYCYSSFTHIYNCTVYYRSPCDHSDDLSVTCSDFEMTGIRLVGGNITSEGRVEIQIEDEWYTVCDSRVSTYGFDTICKQLGYREPLNVYYNAYFGEGTGGIISNIIYCSSDDTHINNCTFRCQSPCDHSNDVSVKCSDFEMTGIRLVGGNLASEGRVEIEIEEEWYTVCDSRVSSSHGFDTICKTLGYRVPLNVYYDAYFGEGTGGILSNHIYCSSDDIHVNNCTFRYQSPCDHSDDVSLRCSDFQTTEVRLVGGNDSSEGRVEIQIEGDWFTVCDQRISTYGLDTICKTLGYRMFLHVYYNAYFGEGTGGIISNSISCTSDDTHINNCSVRYSSQCDHSDDVSLKCSDFMIDDGRLVGGNASNEGRVELFIDNAWRTMCHSYWSFNDLHVLCRTLGYISMTDYFSYAYFGQGTGEILSRDFFCNGDESRLENCTLSSYLRTCSHSEDLSVRCLGCLTLSTPNNGYMNISGTSHGDTALFGCDDGFELVGSSVRICETNNTWNGTEASCVRACSTLSNPNNGYMNISGTSHGDTALFGCDDGFELVGSSVRICETNNTWNGTEATCVRDCGILAPPVNGSVDLSSGTLYHSRAVFACDEGFDLIGMTFRSCKENGLWNGSSPSCKIKACSTLSTPNNGYMNISGTSYGDTAQFGCDDGFELIGSSVRICETNNTWNGTEATCVRDCGILTPPVNGSVDMTSGTVYQSHATFACDEGFDLIGAASRSCQANGLWNGSSPTCEIKDCGNLTDNSAYTVNVSNTIEGGVATYTCVNGYTVDNATQSISTRTCNNGSWVGSVPNCTVVDCGSDITTVTNGAASPIGPTTYESTATVTCTDGYESNITQVTCKADGSWSSANCSLKELTARINETCATDEQCVTEGATCTEGRCKCSGTNIYEDFVDECDAMPVYSYGEDYEDNILDDVDDDCIEADTFIAGLPIFGRVVYTPYICPNGLISFDKSISSSDIWPQIKTLTDEVILSPYHFDIDLKKSGVVFYNMYDINTKKYGLNRDDVHDVNMFVQRYGQVEQFVAKMFLIVTWHEVSPFTFTDRQDQGNATFQLILVSNGIDTFIMYIYGQGKMNWMATDFAPVIWLGYFVGTNDRILVRDGYSFTTQALRMDQNAYTDAVKGVKFYRLTWPGSKPISSIVNSLQCLSWYNLNVNSTSVLMEDAFRLPECPCDLDKLAFDPWYETPTSSVNGIVCAEIWNANVFSPHGKSCCYNTTTRFWLNEQPHAGTFHEYHPNNFFRQHVLQDREPKQQCCFLSENCDKFFELRPIGTCYKETWFDFGIFWGDPHFRTIDGKNFVFNGLGEYTLLRIEAEFTLQARTERAIKIDGSLSEATLFTAFAGQDVSNASIHVEANEEKDGLVIYGNREDLTTSFINMHTSNTPFTYRASEGNLMMTRRRDDLLAFFPHSGISLSISVVAGMLTIRVSIPYKFRNTTTGLMGNYDQNPDNDFITPQGTMYPSNATERELYMYGSQWSIREETSVFWYADGKGHADYQNSTFEPKYLDEQPDELRNMAISFCKGPANIQCIFDYVFTGDERVSNGTLAIEEQSDMDKEEINKKHPNVTGCGTIHIDLSDYIQCNLTVMDNDELTIEFLENSAYAEYDNETNSIIFNKTDKNPVEIHFVGVNSDGKASDTIYIDLLFCTGCSGHGVCTDISRPDSRETLHFKYAQCICNVGYDGPDCEFDYDGCASKPCSSGRNCTDLSPEDEVRLDRTHECTECPQGFTDFEDKCSDIDECALDNAGCDQSCDNIDGGFRCTCREGFKLLPSDNRTCTDIDECLEISSICDHDCMNTDGGYECACKQGYSLNNTTYTCEQDEDFCTHFINCTSTSGCTINDAGEPVCFCRSGLELEIVDQVASCKDINECTRDVCQQTCRNEYGGFQCDCQPGYYLKDTVTCQPCGELQWGYNCSNRCVCEASEGCDPIHGCVCTPGWQGEHCDTDVNECEENVTLCDDVLKTCVNALGSYYCACIAGYDSDHHDTCSDVDECANVELNDCEQLCENVEGGYICNCRDGYTPINSTQCQDVDECELGISGCDHSCENFEGRFNCYCYFGFTLTNDRRTCKEVENPCYSIGNKTCDHICRVDYTKQNTFCDCNLGFELGADGTSCLDIDECVANINSCQGDAQCTNSNGSYMCNCETGTKLENDGLTCTECDAYHFGQNCANNCTCIRGYCNRITGCVCDDGWVGDKCDIDVNECINVTCGVNKMCINTLGSYICSCLNGYHLTENGTCIDRNECTQPTENNCDQICVNTLGSYACNCLGGFLKQDERCKDIDECLNFQTCDHQCENTIGGFRCSCNDGFNLNRTDRRTCIDIDECQIGSHMCEDGCINTDGSYTCTCQQGYEVTGFNCTQARPSAVSNNQQMLIMIGSGGAFIAAVLVVTVIAYRCRRHRIQKRKRRNRYRRSPSTPQETDHSSNLADQDPVTENTRDNGKNQDTTLPIWLSQMNNPNLVTASREVRMIPRARLNTPPS